MTLVSDSAPLASFEAKWGAAYPELGLGLGFVAAAQRRAQAAFACIAFEIEHAAFAVRETEPATIKLQWWAEELARAGRGEPRHPLTQALAEHPALTALPPAHWYALITGALAQRDPEPAATRAAQLEGYAALYGPLATIEALLFPPLDAAASARVRALARALRETAALAEALRDSRLPLPLDLLARHRLSRGELAQTSPQQASALRDWLAQLAADLGAASAGARLGPLQAAAASADRWRARKAARAADPAAALAGELGRLPLRATWAAWRGALRSSG